MTDVRPLYFAAVWLTVLLVCAKACFLGVPAGRTFSAGYDYLRSLAAISYADVAFAAVVWTGGSVLVRLGRGRPIVARGIVAFSALACAYALASIMLFGVFGGFATYSLIDLTLNVPLLHASVAAQLTRPAVLAIVAVTLLHLALVHTALRLARPTGQRSLRHWVAFSVMAVWLIAGRYSYVTTWSTRQEHRVAENPHWVLLSSSWRAFAHRSVSMDRGFDATDLTDFEPIGRRTVARPARQAIAHRPPNVILIVLESVAARWTSLNGGLYETTPNLKAESAWAVAFDNVYAHVGRSSNSLPAMLLSVYPKLDFRDLTQQNPRLPGTSVASTFQHRGYRTSFITPADLSWGGWDMFLEGRGFDEVRDYRRLVCTPLLSPWGVEDRCMVDAMIELILRERARPFFVMAWTAQTHYPYEPTPGVPLLGLTREPGPDDYELERYLNVLHETDRELRRLFDVIRRAGLDQDTLVVITGDHGQAFGAPHNSYAQGVTAYEEDVHVPLLIWFPREYSAAVREAAIGSHVDLAPTIADLAGIPAAPDWQGRSLFDTERVPRAYFYVAEDGFALGVRENQWKYIFDLRTGVDELYDLDRDPTEQNNRAVAEPERCARLRQRLAAWMEANRLQYESQ